MADNLQCRKTFRKIKSLIFELLT